MLGTGVTGHTERNNIYDLAGNFYEWTTETEKINVLYYVARGGAYLDKADSHEGVQRNCINAVYSDHKGVGFRSVLYINGI